LGDVVVVILDFLVVLINVVVRCVVIRVGKVLIGEDGLLVVPDVGTKNKIFIIKFI